MYSYWGEIGIALGETLYMVVTASFFSILLGLPLGLILFTTRPQGLRPHPVFYRLLNLVANVFRSIPFIILLALLIPVTRFLVGSSIGSTATIVPLTIAAIPFFGRLTENIFLELPFGLIEAGVSFGASPLQIIRTMLLPEAMPALINSMTVTVVTLISYSAMAGAVGGGGLGALAIDYGYQRFDLQILLIAVFVLVILVQAVQSAGDWLSKKCAH